MAALLAGHSQLKGLSDMFHEEDCVAVSCHPGQTIERLFGGIKDIVHSFEVSTCVRRVFMNFYRACGPIILYPHSYSILTTDSYDNVTYLIKCAL